MKPHEFLNRKGRDNDGTLARVVKQIKRSSQFASNVVSSELLESLISMMMLAISAHTGAHESRNAKPDPSSARPQVCKVFYWGNVEVESIVYIELPAQRHVA